MTIGDTHLDHAEALLAILRREHDALLNGDLDAVELLTREKQTALAEFEPLLRTLPATAGQTPAERVQRFSALAAECRRQNEINGGMIEASLRHTQSLLRLLRGQPPQAALYSARGKTDDSSSPGRPLASA